MSSADELSGTVPLLAGLGLAGARELLKEEKAEADDAELALQRAVEAALQNEQELCEREACDRELNGMDERDARAVEFLESLGKGKGAELERHALDVADQWRNGARDRWSAYTRQTVLAGVDDPKEAWLKWADTKRWQRLLAKGVAIVLWHGRVRAEVENERERGVLAPPGVAAQVAAQLQASFWAVDTSLAAKAGAEGVTSLELVNPAGEVVASTPTLRPEQVEVLQRGTAKLRSYSGHVALRKLAVEGHRRTRALEALPSVLGYEGGITGWRSWLGLKGKRVETELAGILMAGQSFNLRWPGGEVGGLWTYVLRRSAPGRQAFLEIRLGAPLMPYYAKGLEPKDRFVVPLVAMPPRVGRENDWAAQAAFQFSLVRALVDHRVALVREGGAKLPLPELLRLAEGVGLPAGTVAAVLDRWTHDGPDGEKCLERIGTDRYHLPNNPTYRAAREFLNGAGERSLKRSKAGQAAVRQRGKR